MSVAPSAPKPRVMWLDAARAFAVVAVVVSHYQIYVMRGEAADFTGLARIWPEFVDQMQPVRMPLLLFMSGMLASSRLLGSAISAATRSASSFYLNAVWVTAYFLISIPLTISSAGATDSFRSWALHVVLPSENLWFVWALGFWAAAFIFLRHLPMPLVLALFAVTGVLGDALRGDIPSRWVAVLVYGVFFALGVYGKHIMFAFVETRLVTKTLTLGVMYVAMQLIFRTTSMDPVVRSLLIDVRSIIALACFAALFALLTKAQWFARPVAFLGRHTLSIFVMHMPFVWLIMDVDSLRDAITPDGLVVLWPVIGVPLVIGASLGLEWLLRRVGASVLFELPSWLSPAWHAARRSRR